MTDNDIIKGLENWTLKDLIVIWCNDKDNNLMPVTVKDILKVINNLKAEVVKEVAEKVKEDIATWNFDFTYYSDVLEASQRIDSIAKRMAGENI